MSKSSWSSADTSLELKLLQEQEFKRKYLGWVYESENVYTSDNYVT